MFARASVDRVVAGVSQAVFHSEVHSGLNNLGLRHLDEGSVDGNCLPFDSSFGRDPGEVLERADEFGSAVGVAAVIDGIDSDEDVVGFSGFGVGKGKTEHDGVPGRDVGDGDVVAEAVFGHFDVVGESTSSECRKVYGEDFVFGDEGVCGNGSGGIELNMVPLTVLDGKAVGVIALRLGNGETGCGIETAAE